MHYLILIKINNAAAQSSSGWLKLQSHAVYYKSQEDDKGFVIYKYCFVFKQLISLKKNLYFIYKYNFNIFT